MNQARCQWKVVHLLLHGSSSAYKLLFSVVVNGQEHLSRGSWKIGMCYYRMLCRGDAFNLNRPCQNIKHTKEREVTEKKIINNFLESEI